MRSKAHTWLVVVLIAASTCSPASFKDALAGPALPSGLSRFNPAGLADNWQYEGTAFLAQRTALPSVPSVDVLRFRSGQGDYVLTSSNAEALAAKGAGDVAEGLAFVEPSKSTVPVYRFRIPANDSLFYTTSRKEGDAARFRLGHRVLCLRSGPGRSSDGDSGGQVPQQGYRDLSLYCLQGITLRGWSVLFWFFTASAKDIIAGTRRVYGRNGDWWGGVKDFYGAEPGVKEDHRGWPGAWPDLKPQIGYYDQASGETLEQHITQAADAGLTFFSFYWYWSNTAHAEMAPEAFNSFLHARNAAR